MLGVLIVIILFFIAFGGKKNTTKKTDKTIPCKWCGKYYDTNEYGDYHYCSNACKHLDKNFRK